MRTHLANIWQEAANRPERIVRSIGERSLIEVIGEAVTDVAPHVRVNPGRSGAEAGGTKIRAVAVVADRKWNSPLEGIDPVDLPATDDHIQTLRHSAKQLTALADRKVIYETADQPTRHVL